MPKVLLIGGGAREHAIANALAASALSVELYYVAPQQNPGISQIAKGFLAAKVTAIDDIVRYAKANTVDYAIAGPEAALAVGVADALSTESIACVGPTAELAKIETSKSFARELMSTAEIPGLPQFKAFSAYDEAAVQTVLNQLGPNFVIKDDGLCGGKGVKVSGEHVHTHAEAKAYCQEISGPFVIEEKCVGPEFSLLSFVDGQTLKHCPAVQDHKRAFVNDEGPNTGGMGSYSMPDHLLPFLPAAAYQAACKINEQVIDALQQKTGQRYKGILYGGFMLTKQGVRVIEFNARFGDPEAVNVLSLLQSDFGELCQHLIAGTLADADCHFAAEASVVKYVVPNGYPEQPVKETIDVSAIADQEQLFYAAVTEADASLVMTGSRAIAVLGRGADLAEAENQAEAAAAKIQGLVFYRRDVGTAALVSKYKNMVEDFA